MGKRIGKKGRNLLQYNLYYDLLHYRSEQDPRHWLRGRGMLVRHVFKEAKDLLGEGWLYLCMWDKERESVTVSVRLTTLLTAMRLKRKIKFSEEGDFNQSDCVEIKSKEHQVLMFYRHLQILIICSLGQGLCLSLFLWYPQQTVFDYDHCTVSNIY